MTIEKNPGFSAHIWIVVPFNSYIINFWYAQYYYKTKNYTNSLFYPQCQVNRNIKCSAVFNRNIEDWRRGQYLHYKCSMMLSFF